MTTSSDTMIDPQIILDALRNAGLDPRDTPDGERFQFHCPEGCGKRKRKSYYNKRMGAWYCQRCKGHAGYNRLLDILGVARDRRKMRFTQSSYKAQEPTISMMRVAKHFASSNQRRVHETKLRAYFNGRAWPKGAQDLALSTVGLCWVEQPIDSQGNGEDYKHTDLTQFAQSCAAVSRQIVTLLFDEEGRPHSAMRRPIGTPSDSMPKAMRISNILVGSSPKGGVFFGDVRRSTERDVILLVEGDADYVAGSALCAHLASLDVDAACVGVVGLTHRKAAHAILRQRGEHTPTVLVCPDIDSSGRGQASAREGLAVLAQHVPVAVLNLSAFANDDGEVDLSDALAEYGLKTLGKLAKAALDASMICTEDAKALAIEEAEEEEEGIDETLHEVLGDASEVAEFIADLGNPEREGNPEVTASAARAVYLDRIKGAVKRESKVWSETDAEVLPQAIADALKTTNIPKQKRIADRIVKEAYQVTRRAAALKEREQRRKEGGTNLGSIWKSAPKSIADHRMPDGYATDERGAIYRLKTRVDMYGNESTQPIRVSLRPLYIDSMAEDLTTGDQFMSLGWKWGRSWQACRPVGRENVASKRDLIKATAQKRAPIEDTNAREVIQYLFDYEHTNLEHIQTDHLTSRMGWHLDRESFVLGDRSFGKEVTLRPPGPGERQIATGYKKAGSFEAWKDLALLANPYPRVLLSMYAALSPPWLDIFGAPNFAIDWSYENSKGKTTLLKLGASCWGLPDPNKAGSAMGTWRSTQVGFELRGALLNSLPLILDETKHMKERPKEVGDVIYSVVNGQGRGRGQAEGGMRRSSETRSVLMSTGEDPLTSFVTDGGVSARVIVINGLPFQRTWSLHLQKDAHGNYLYPGNAKASLEYLSREHQASVTDQLNKNLPKHYGHAGPAMIQRMMDADDAERARWQEVWKEERAKWKKIADNSQDFARMNRVSEYFAFLDAVGRIVHPWIFEDDDYETWSPCVELANELVTEVKQVDRARQALDVVVEWAEAHRLCFDGGGNSRPPGGSWYGRWDEKPSGDKENDTIDISAHWCNDQLNRAGYNAQSIRKIWYDRGWLKYDKRKKTRRVSIDGKKMSCVSILKSIAVPEPEESPT